MKVVTAEEMRDIDRNASTKYGISGAVLMERAGLAVAGRIRDLFEKIKIIVLSGGGNNGGDGLAAARNLFNWGWNVKVLVMAKEDRMTPDCLAQYRNVRKAGVAVEFRTSLSDKDLHSAVVVDALFGTGLNKPVAAPLSNVISVLNRSSARVISVDIPSGISADDGQILGEAVMADHTVTFGLPKRGHLLYPGAAHSGRLFVEDIGFPKGLLHADSLKVQSIERVEMSFLVPERPACSHKGDYGHVLVVAGSKGKIGAALMSAKASLRSGAGLVTLGVPETLVNIYQGRITEEMVLPLPDDGQGVLAGEACEVILDFLNRRADVLAIGPGISTGPSITRLMTVLVKSATSPMVIDADAINSVGAGTLKRGKAPIILTPHPGEMARLIQKGEGSAKDIAGSNWNRIKSAVERDRINAAVSFSKSTGTYLVLKGAPTLIAEPEGRTYINTTGNPGMATAGAGDVLTGMVSALLAQGLNPVDASRLGVYLHGLAGDMAASEKGMHSLIATDIIEKVPEAFLDLIKSEQTHIS